MTTTNQSKLSAILIICCLQLTPALGQPQLTSPQQVNAADNPHVPVLNGWATNNGVMLTQGSRFKVELLTPLTSANAVEGTLVQCRFLYDIVVHGAKVFSKDEVISGFVSDFSAPQKTLRAYVPTKHFLNANARFGLTFDSIDTKHHGPIKISAQLVPQSYVIQAQPSDVKIIVDKDGKVSSSYSTKRFIALSAAMTAATYATGPVGMLVAPAVTGTAGAISSTYANGRPLENGETNNRAKNTLLGVSKGVPGGTVISGLSTRGSHVFLEQGDQLLIQLDKDVVIPQ